MTLLLASSGKLTHRVNALKSGYRFNTLHDRLIQID
jgi:hypothetical protein